MKTVGIISYEVTRYFQSEMDHVRKLSDRKSLPILFEFTDTSTHRQSQLGKAMQTIQSQGPYLIVVPSMSRLAPDQRKLCRYVLQILKAKSSIYFIEERLTFTPCHLKSITLFQSLLKLDKDLKSYKIRRGMMLARAHGTVGRRPKITVELEQHIMDLRTQGVSIR